VEVVSLPPGFNEVPEAQSEGIEWEVGNMGFAQQQVLLGEHSTQIQGESLCLILSPSLKHEVLFLGWVAWN
jgi:hypothetical protein